MPGAETLSLACQAIPVHVSYLAESLSLFIVNEKKYFSDHCRTRGLLDEIVHSPSCFFPLACSLSLFFHALK